MEHVVFFPAPDGSPAFRRIASLEEAVRLVEHLRNVEGISSVSVHTLTEVPLAFRAYYRVEVPTDAVPEQQVVSAEAPVEQPVAAEPVQLQPEGVEVADVPPLALVEDVPVEDVPAEEPVLVSSNGSSSAASLGFFA